MAEYIYAKHFRNLKEFTITKIYAPYRNGGLEIDGMFVPRTFKYSKGKIMEEKWVGETGSRKPELQETDIKIDKDFFFTYKKVFDVQLSTPVEVELDGKKGTEFVIKGLGFSKVKDMLREDFDLKIPMVTRDVKGEDGTVTAEEKEAFDWEDSVYQSLEGKSYKMKVTGQMLDTRYQYKLISDAKPASEPVEEKETVDSVEDLLPF